MNEVLNKIDLTNLEKTKFLGYEQLNSQSKVIGLFDEKGLKVTKLSGHGYVIFDQTPFYAISGGQDSDQGEMVFKKNRFNIIDVRKDIVLGYFIHEVDLNTQSIEIADVVDLEVNKEFRYNSSLNHSALHITWQTILNHVGYYVEELGSKLNNDRYQLQFCNDDKITPQLVLEVVNEINQKIIPENVKSKIFSVTQEEAHEKNYLFEFTKINPGEMVRMVEFPKIVIEPCSGTHANSTKELKQVWFMNYSKNNKAVIIDMTTNKLVADNYFENKLTNRFAEILNQIKKAVDLGMNHNFKDQIDACQKLTSQWNYLAVRELNEIGLQITALINKYLKNLEQESIKNFLSQEFKPKIIKDKFHYYQTADENYTNKLLISKASILANENPNNVIVFANQGQASSNVVLVCNQKADFNIKSWFEKNLADQSSFKGGGGPLIIQLFSSIKEDFDKIIPALEKA